MELEIAANKLAELNQEFEKLKAKLNKPEVQLMPMIIREVFPGDVWYYPPNRDINKDFYTVKSVNKKKNLVYFTDGWNPLDDMLSGKWVLVARKLTPELKEKIKKL